jgi:type II secretory pathway component PulC
MNSMRAHPVWLWTRRRWVSHGPAVIRRAIEATLLVGLCTLCWRLIALWLPTRLPTQLSTHPTAVSPPPASGPDENTRMDALIHDHLFGVPAVASTRAVPVSTTSSLTVNGIVYSSTEEKSVVILTQNGASVVGRKGMQLPDGETIVSVLPDRIVVNRHGVVESVLLDIKKAAIDAHFTPAQFASSGGMDLNSLNSDEPRPIDEAPIPSESPAASQAALTGARPTLVPSHFKSLRQLRGQDAMRHFQNANPPGF